MQCLFLKRFGSARRYFVFSSSNGGGTLAGKAVPHFGQTFQSPERGVPHLTQKGAKTASVGVTRIFSSSPATLSIIGVPRPPTAMTTERALYSAACFVFSDSVLTTKTP